MQQDLVITSWGHLQEELFADSWSEEILRYRSPFVFRGLSDANYRLISSLIRLEGPYVKLEKHMLRNFRKYAEGTVEGFRSFWHLLSLAQHHGLPTRMMDWTYSPWIALHFATSSIDKFHLDGAIWMLNYRKCHELLPHRLRDSLDKEGAEVFTVELLNQMTRSPGADVEGSFYRMARSLEDFDRLGDESEFLLFLEPPSIDRRLINQFALFSVLSNPARGVDDWLKPHPDLWRRLIIPAELKWECRDKLDQANVTERVLFPGLDGLCDWLRRHYAPSGHL